MFLPHLQFGIPLLAHSLIPFALVDKAYLHLRTSEEKNGRLVLLAPAFASICTLERQPQSKLQDSRVVGSADLAERS